jgi:hypothetical protein
VKKRKAQELSILILPGRKRVPGQLLMLSKSVKHRLLEQAGMKLLQYCHGNDGRADWAE